MDKIEFSNKNFTHEINLKKVRALINYAAATYSFKDKAAVTFLHNWVIQEMLDDEGQHFLDHLLEKHKINYLDWCCMNKWVKKNIQQNIINAASFYEIDEKQQKCIKTPWKNYLPPKKMIRIKQLDLPI